MATEPNFDITINYPTLDNQKAYEERVSSAVAKVLTETLSIEQIDELIELYNQKNNL